jgi:hypothetical protein
VCAHRPPAQRWIAQGNHTIYSDSGRCEKTIWLRKKFLALRLHITGRGVELLDPQNRLPPVFVCTGEFSHETATNFDDVSGIDERIVWLLRYGQSMWRLGRLLRSTQRVRPDGGSLRRWLQQRLRLRFLRRGRCRRTGDDRPGDDHYAGPGLHHRLFAAQLKPAA